MRLLVFASLVLFVSTSSFGRPASGDLLVCRGEGFQVSLSSLGKLRLSENSKTCELEETKIADHRRSTFSHIAIAGIQRGCKGFENWMTLIDVKIHLDDRQTGQIIGRSKQPTATSSVSELTPTCRLDPINIKRLDLFFSSKRE
jgi:hypothetical protein